MLDTPGSAARQRPRPAADHDTIRAALDHPPAETGLDPALVVEECARDLGGVDPAVLPCTWIARTVLCEPYRPMLSLLAGEPVSSPM